VISSAAYSPNETTRYNAPLHVAAVDQDGDGQANVIMTAQGSDGTTRLIRSTRQPAGGVLPLL